MKISDRTLAEEVWKLISKYEPTPEEIGAAVARAIYGHAYATGMRAGIEASGNMTEAMKSAADSQRMAGVASGLTRRNGG